MSRAYVFVGMSLLLILPAILLAGSFLSMIHTGDIATSLALRSDVVSYAYKNIQNNFEIAACSYFLLTNDTAAIRGNLTQVWTPYVEANFSTGLGITVSIDESKINVTYDSATDSIKVGNVNNMDAAIPMNITVAGIRHDLGLKAVQIYRSCGRETTAAAETQTPSVTLFLHKQGNNYIMDTTDPPCTSTERTTISAGESRVWQQSPAFNTSFNITGNIDVYLYLKPSTPTYPTVTVKLYYGSSTLGSPVGYLVDNESWYVFTFTGVAGTVVPASTPLKLNVSVSGANSWVEVWYDYCDYNSGIVIPGSQTTGAADTTPPVIKNVLVKKITSSSATIVWTTDESSDSLVRYSNGTAAGYNSSNATFHSVTLTGLASSTTYSFQVESTDSSNNRATDNNGGAYYSFTTTSGSEVKEILWVDGAVSGPDKDAINANVSILRYFNDNQYVVVDGNEEDVVSFENASSTVSYVTSAMLYWADVRESGSPSRNLTLGNLTGNWSSYQSNAPNTLTVSTLNVSSYFLSSTNDAVDLGNILLRYRNRDATKKIDWDQAYLNVTYYTP